jgi:hypothetical protein
MKTKQFEKALELAQRGYNFYEISKVIKVDQNIIAGMLDMFKEDEVKVKILCKFYDLGLTSRQASGIIKTLKDLEVLDG